MSTAALRNAVNEVQTGAHEAIEDAKQMGHDAKSDLAGYKDEIMSAVSSAAGSAKKAYKKAGKGAEQAYEYAKDHTVDAAHGIEKYVRNNPMTCVAIAAGVGLLVGGLLMHRRD